MDPRQEPVLGSHVPHLGVIAYTVRERYAGEVFTAIDKFYPGIRCQKRPSRTWHGSFTQYGLMRLRNDVGGSSEGPLQNTRTS